MTHFAVELPVRSSLAGIIENIIHSAPYHEPTGGLQNDLQSVEEKTPVGDANHIGGTYHYYKTEAT